MTEFVITGSTPIQFVALPIAAAGQNPATLSNGLNSNIATGGQPTVRLSGPSAAFSVGGFQLPGAATPQAGQALSFTYTGQYALTVVHEDLSSAATARISVTGAQNMYIPTGAKVTLIFDGALLRWVLAHVIIRPTEFNIIDYGADPTGSADSTTAITNAIVAANAAGGGRVVATTGTYAHTGFSLLDYVHFVGKGSKGSVILNGTGHILIDGKQHWGIKNVTVESTVDGIIISTHAGPNQEWVMEDVTVPVWGATSYGIQFLCDMAGSNNYVYFGRMRNVQVVQTGASMAGAVCVGIVGTTTQVIGLSWLGGRVAGAGIGLDWVSADGCGIRDVEFDDINILASGTTISGLNTSTGVFNDVAHGYVNGDIILVSGVTGTSLTQVNGYHQVISYTTNTWTSGVLMSGTYSSGGIGQKATGIAIHLGANASGNTIEGRLEGETLDRYVVCESASYGNVARFSPNSAPLAKQMSDLSASQTNVMIAGVGSNGFNSTNPNPESIGGVLLGAGAVSAATFSMGKAGATQVPLSIGVSTGTLTLNAAQYAHGYIEISGSLTGH